MLKTKQFLCDCKNAQVRQGRPNQQNQHQNPIQSNRTEPHRTEPNKTRLKWLSVGYISVSENIAGMCKKSCIKLVSTWVTRSGPGCCSLEPFSPFSSPVSAACCLWPLAGLIYFKTSQTLEQHVRSTKFLACLTRLGIVLVALVFVALPQLMLFLLLSLAFAVKKPLKYDAYDKLKCAAHIDETECHKCYKHFDDKR